MIDAVFVLAATAFFKEQMGLKGNWVLLATFLVVLFVALEEAIIGVFPKEFAPFVSQVVFVIKLFLASAGSYDLALNVSRKMKNT